MKRNPFFALDPLAQRVGIRRVAQGGVAGDPVLLIQAHELAVHGEHGLVAAAVDHVVDLVRAAVADHVLDRGVDTHDFEDGNAAAAHVRHQALGNHGPQHHGQLHADLRLLLRGEGVDDAVDGLGRADGVQGAEQQMPGLSGGDRRADSIQIAHFAQHHHVRRLPEGRP